MDYPISDTKPANFQRMVRFVLPLSGCLAFAYPLLGYVISGTYARYIQDDYCYAAYLARYPFFEGQIFSYLHIDTYSGNRYSLNLLTGISELFGQVSVQVLPGIAVVLCVMSYLLLLQHISRMLGIKLSPLELLLGAEALAFLSLYQAPNLFQVLYWRAGMLPYLAPIITDIFMAAFILHRVDQLKSNPSWLAVSAVLAFLAAGFSETAAAFQAGLAFISMALAFFRMKAGSRKALHALRFSSVVLVSTFFAMLVLIVSPINARRLVGYPEAPALASFFAITIESSLQLLVYNAYRLTTLLLFTFVLFLWFALLYFRRNDKIPVISFKQLRVSLVLLHITNFLLSMCCAAPSVYFYSNSPDARVMTAAQFTTVLSIAGSGFLAGWWWSLQARRLKLEPHTFYAATFTSSAVFYALFFIMRGSPIEPAYPDIRSHVQQLPLQLLLLPAGILLAAILLNIIKRYFDKTTAYTLVYALFFTLLFCQPFKGAQRIYDEIPQYRLRAEKWDCRDRLIRQAEQNAERRVTVEALDSMYGVADLQMHPDNWLNNCAEWYYGMEWISAVEQGE